MLYLVGVISILIKISLTEPHTPVQERFNQSLAKLSVEKEQICANRRDLLTLSCTLAVRNMKNVLKNWTLSWHSEGIPLTENATERWQNASRLTSQLRLNVDWSGEKLFTCVASQYASNVGKYLAFLNSTSVVKVRKPIHCDIIGFRLMEQPMFHTLEVYWRPVKPAVNITYTMMLCAEELLDDDVTHVCPHYYSVNSSCFYRNNDLYNLPDTKGFTCTASVSFYSGLNMYITNRVHISSKVERDSCEHRCSNDRRFYLTVSRELFPEPDTTEVVLIPTPVERLSVVARAPREVTLIWSDPLFVNYAETRRYRVRYKCSNDSSWNTTAWLIQTKVTLNSKSFQNYQPYDLCRFCVTARAFKINGLGSEPLCEEIRLHEEPPSSAPTVMCPQNECQTMRNEYERNVSITWTLPPRTDWNGALTAVKVIYRSAHEKSLGYFSDFSNSIEVDVRNNTTRGQTLLTGLSINQTYWIHMVACNKEGCSSPGKEFKVASLPPKASHDEHSVLRMPIKAITLVASTATIFLTACLIYVTYTCVKTRRDMRPKLQLEICEQSGYDVIMENKDKVEYDVLVVLDEVRYVDITRLDVYTKRQSYV